MSHLQAAGRAQSTTQLDAQDIQQFAGAGGERGSLGLLSRLQGTNSTTFTQNNASASGLGREYWLDDATATKCRDCDRTFTTFLRKHHCRICGKIFCHNCTRFIDGAKFNHKGKLRVCFFCHNKLQKYEDYNSSEDEPDETMAVAPLSSSSTSSSNHNAQLLHHRNSHSRSHSHSQNNSLFNNKSMHSPIRSPYRSSANKELPMLHNSKIRARGNSSIKSPPMAKRVVNTLDNGSNIKERDSSDTDENDDEECSDSSTNSDASTDDENNPGSGIDGEGMISLMSNHEFNWPSNGGIAEFKFTNAVNSPAITPTNAANGNSFIPYDSYKRGDINKNLNHPRLSSSHLHQRNTRRNFSSRGTHSRIFSNSMLNSKFKRMNLTLNTDIIHFTDDLQKASESYNEILLNEVIIDKQLPDVDFWCQKLSKSLKKVNNIEIELNKDPNGATYDFQDFIKFKKIEGDKYDDVEAIEGLVFSKKLPLKNMPLKIESPKIMIITFAIEYDQNIIGEPTFTSLDSVIAQQDEYLKKLTDRIIHLNPSIIVSSNSINFLVLKRLAENGISASPNCKPTNLFRLAKFTNATIITSIDMLVRNPVLGKCDMFQQRYFQVGDLLKSYFFFTGCNSKVGLTILLRGPNLDVLKRVKEFLPLMMCAFINTNLESSYLRDKYMKLNENFNVMNKKSTLTQPLGLIKLENCDDVNKLTHDRLVSTSPWVKFSPPQIINQIQETIHKLDNIKTYFTQFESDEDPIRNIEIYKQQFSIDDSLAIGNVADLTKMVHSMNDYLLKVNNFQLNYHYRKFEQFWMWREYDFYDPIWNQNITILFSMISSKNSIPCIGPMLHMIEFYWDNDECLGQFIQGLCLSTDHICMNGCGMLLRDHYYSYVHDDGKVDVKLEMTSKEDIVIKTNSITTWSECKVCHEKTNQMPLNDLSNKYSFGKFLQLIFCFDNEVLKLNHSAVNCECHYEDYFKDFIHVFQLNNFIIKFEYSKIDNLKLVTPKNKLFWDPKYDFKIKLDYYTKVDKKCKKFFDSVQHRLDNIQLDSHYVNKDNLTRGELKLAELRDKLIVQRQEIFQMIKNVYNQSELRDYSKLNVVLRKVQEISRVWKLEFDDFAKEFLPTVKEMKSNFQLEKLLNIIANKDDEEDEDDDEHDEKKRERGQSEDTSAIQEGDSTISNESSLSTINPVRKKSSLVLSRINELNESFGSNGSTTPVGPLLGKPSQESLNLPKDFNRLDLGQVKKLKKLFENDTQNFFNERERMEMMNTRGKYLPKVGTMNSQVKVNSNQDLTESRSLTQSVVSTNNSLSNQKQHPSVNIQTNTGTVSAATTIQTDTDDKNKEEKNWFLKMMTNFIDTRTSTSWVDFSYPLGPTEHIYFESDVIIREDEPSSIIAFCLSTIDYQSKIYADKPNEITDEYLQSIFVKPGFHLPYQIEGNNSNSMIECKVFFAEQFDALRKKCGLEENFVNSISRCVKWDSTGGKSGAVFLKTLDDRFILKELSKSEMEAFVKMARDYFGYFEKVLFQGLPSVLAKIFGVYQIQVKSSTSNKSYTIDVVLMENLFYNWKPDRIFDLKGSMRNRHVEQTGKANEVLLDENMVEYIYESPIFVREGDKKLLRMSLWNDTLFLEKMNVMDYSLVVGIDSSSEELVVGIIDCIRTFTWDKKLESWVKEKGLVGSSGVGREPTVITPRQYKNRFREAMERYILLAPGPYYQARKTRG